MCCSVLQCVAVCCSVLQCVAVCCGEQEDQSNGKVPVTFACSLPFCPHCQLQCGLRNQLPRALSALLQCNDVLQCTIVLQFKDVLQCKAVLQCKDVLQCKYVVQSKEVVQCIAAV